MLYGLADWQWWCGGLWAYFLILCVIWWPGYWLLGKVTGWRRLTRFFAGNALGAVMLAVVAYFSGCIGIYSLVYLYMLLAGGSLVVKIWRERQRARRLMSELVAGIKRQKILMLLIFLGLVLQMPAVFGSGLRRSDGVHFIFSNYKDGLMHVGFINSLAQEFPPLRPEVNVRLQNYHYFSDLVLAQLVRVGVASVNLLFQYFPVWWSIVMTGTIYTVAREVCGSQKVAGWVTLTFLLAGDGAYWLTFFFPGNNGWQMASLDNGVDQFFNPPYVMAKVIFLLSWGLLNEYWSTGKKRTLVLLVAVLVPLTLFKVYWTLLFGSGWVISWCWRALARGWKQKKLGKPVKILDAKMGWELGAIAIVAAGSSLLLWRSMSDQAAKMAWVPFLWPRLLISTDHLGWDAWELRQQVYAEVPSWRRNLVDHILLLVVALIYVYGARLAGLVLSKKTLQKLSLANYLFFLAPAVGWTFVGFNFLQGVGNFNSFNFLIIAGVALLIPLGVNLSAWWEHKWGKIAVIVVLASFLPRLAYGWSEYIGQTVDGKGVWITSEQLDFFARVKSMTAWEDVLLVNPDNDYTVAASVYPALAGRRTWVSARQVLETHDLDFSEREQQARDVIHNVNVTSAMSIAADIGADWIVLDEWDAEHERDYAMPVATVEAVWRGSEGVIIKVERPALE